MQNEHNKIKKAIIFLNILDFESEFRESELR